ncbi:hypothetical protein MFU01_78620 [Myxococcus fulvus]|uniref:4Fe-4S Mo/W bis-MGD-type domain-containing protein n=1 Tax=Myxococcus fulvus TaxID=33 RepID=A0A511TF73_MYXFU|nr:hypothetical protein [Myxococcus fulvus]GEN12825.1 hypothetical protein MFU01_78620 [Myxococcus fulvus]
MGILDLMLRWPVLRRIASGSVCPHCAVGCGQDTYDKDERIIDIKGDSDSPMSRGHLCPEGSATFQFVTGTHAAF